MARQDITLLRYVGSVQIWNRVKAAKPAEGSGLTREQFGVALRLVAFAQTEPHPTPEAMEAAASSAAWQATRGQPLPAPQLLPDARSALYSNLTSRKASGTLGWSGPSDHICTVWSDPQAQSSCAAIRRHLYIFKVIHAHLKATAGCHKLQAWRGAQ